MIRRAFILCFAALALSACATVEKEDPYLWLEDVEGDKALEWVEARNQATAPQLEAVPGFKEANEKLMELLNSRDRIPYARQRDQFYYNFWQDGDHPRGLYRRTTLEEYRKDNPAWETIIDLDALAKEEGENWVYSGIDFLYPDYERALLSLSRGGADAVVVREFHLPTRSFVKDGFILPEAKCNVSWKDEDHIYVGTDFGDRSLTASGYPRQVKLWERNTPLSEAKTLFETPPTSITAVGGRFFSEEGNLDFVMDVRSFFDSDFYLLLEDKQIKLDLPEGTQVQGYFKKQLILKPRSDWKVGDRNFKAGSILIGHEDDLLAGEMKLTLLMEPTERLSISSVDTTRNTLLITVLDNVVSKLYQFTPDQAGKWRHKQVETEPNGTVRVFNTSEKSDDYFITYQSFLTPPSLYRVAGGSGEMELLKRQPPRFDASPYKVLQYKTRSADGTMIPYFIVMKKKVAFDSRNPTLLYGYGGFMVSEEPGYLAGKGNLWLDRGGVYVVANIRGGGEFGPCWHQAALLKNKHKSYEDFIAVAEDLIRRKITSPEKLGIQGGSNGGLLVGAVFVKRPDLFKAVVCQAPLLDMKRYTKLLAGASWASEYGDPDDPDMWDYIKTYSPYHNVKEGADYPAVLFTTSTRDDRVHPGHTRKMMARMMEMGYTPFYYENTEGGHAGAANNKQRAYMAALAYAFLYQQLMEP